MSPRARPPCHKAGEGQGQQPGRASSHGFIQHSTSVQRLLEEKPQGRQKHQSRAPCPSASPGNGDRGIPSLSVVAQTDIPGLAAGASAPCSCFWQIPSAWPSRRCRIPLASASLLRGKQGKISSMLTGDVRDGTSRCPNGPSRCPRVWPRTSGPVINVPVVAGLVDEAVIAVQLLLAHACQVFLGKEAGEGWVRMSRR